MQHLANIPETQNAWVNVTWFINKWVINRSYSRAYTELGYLGLVSAGLAVEHTLLAIYGNVCPQISLTFCHLHDNPCANDDTTALDVFFYKLEQYLNWHWSYVHRYYNKLSKLHRKFPELLLSYCLLEHITICALA